MRSWRGLTAAAILGLVTATAATAAIVAHGVDRRASEERRDEASRAQADLSGQLRLIAGRPGERERPVRLLPRGHEGRVRDLLARAADRLAAGGNPAGQGAQLGQRQLHGHRGALARGLQRWRPRDRPGRRPRVGGRAAGRAGRQPASRHAPHPPAGLGRARVPGLPARGGLPPRWWTGGDPGGRGGLRRPRAGRVAARRPPAQHHRSDQRRRSPDPRAARRPGRRDRPEGDLCRAHPDAGGGHARAGIVRAAGHSSWWVDSRSPA